MMKNIYGIDSSAPSGRIFFLFYFPGVYTKTGLVFGFSKNQILVAVIPGQKAPRTLLGQNCFWISSENNFEMGINPRLYHFAL
jgi:hypothetical protein